jgi:hypothetical protein
MYLWLKAINVLANVVARIFPDKKSCKPMLLFSNEIVEVQDSDDDDDINKKKSKNTFTTPATSLLKKTITPDDGNNTTPGVDTNHTINYNTPSLLDSVEHEI